MPYVPKSSGGIMREIVLDTETTGFDPDTGDRLVEIGAVELLNHLPTGRNFHKYVNPERDMPEGAFAVHGLSSEFLSDKPLFAEVAAEALGRAAPDLAAFRQAALEYPHFGDRLSLHLYAHDGEGKLRARMFAPNSGTVEDPATGSANATLAALLLSLSTEDAGAWDIIQGVELARPSRLHATARRTSGDITATVGGGCVPVLRGEATI